MRIDRLGTYDQLPTIVCTTTIEDMYAIPTVAEAGCSISWFVSGGVNFQKLGFSEPIAVLIAMTPSLIHVFGEGAERIHDSIDLALQAVHQFAVTLWSEAYTIDQAVFDIFRVDFPPEESVGQWSSRLIILDESIPAFKRAALIEQLRDPDASIRDYLGRT